MPAILSGIRVLEVASWTFVPAAGAVLAEWGADVLKIEHPVRGDPQRGLISSGLVPAAAGGFNYMIEQPNQGKRSIGLNLASDEGKELLYRLAETSDVFLTNVLPATRAKLGIDLDDIRARNPEIIYVRGSGQGVRGPDATKGGYDGASYWARGGIAAALTPKGLEPPVNQRPAFGDVMGGLTIAGGIAAALVRRERTGDTSVVDVSLLATALWNISPDVVAAKLFEHVEMPTFALDAPPNPLVGMFRTEDGRYISLVMLESDKYWADFCEHLGRADLVADPRFVDAGARYEHRRECRGVIADTFASAPLAAWRERFATMKGVWAVVQNARELHDDPQVDANGYLPTVTADDGTEVALVASPVQFDETPPTLVRAPEHGQHTEEVLLELGLSWDDLVAYKESGAIL
ncbi:MAG TPA: CoA transferase [Acidimicrobiia bacterium]|nr:CoA transferase [Acidimicrobiia bacterium]